MPWTRLLKAFDAAERHNNKTRGFTFSDPDTSTITLVRDYLRVVRYGTLKDISEAVRRDESGVRRALAGLTTTGEVAVTESLTRGPDASKRKTYHTSEQSVWAGKETGWREVDFWASSWNDD